jgi:1-acyl-sn-glycerol-3-phosphate acyltransferase
MNRAVSSSRSFSPLRRYVCIYTGLPFLALICLVWSVIALPAYYLLPVRSGTALGRSGIRAGFRLYLGFLKCMGAYRFDIKVLDGLRKESRVILAPNHPNLIDALILLAYHPNLVCVMKTDLRRNVFFGAGARLARFVCNSPPRRMIKEAIAALNDGGVLLLFPEGTRSVRAPVNELQLTVGAIAKYAKVPVLSVLIEIDSPYLSKNWPLFRLPRLPITYRVRLGRRFNPPTDARQFTGELEAYFRHELANSLQAEWLQCSTSDRVS